MENRYFSDPEKQNGSFSIEAVDDGKKSRESEIKDLAWWCVLFVYN